MAEPAESAGAGDLNNMVMSESVCSIRCQEERKMKPIPTYEATCLFIAMLTDF